MKVLSLPALPASAALENMAWVSVCDWLPGRNLLPKPSRPLKIPVCCNGITTSETRTWSRSAVDPADAAEGAVDRPDADFGRLRLTPATTQAHSQPGPRGRHHVGDEPAQPG